MMQSSIISFCWKMLCAISVFFSEKKGKKRGWGESDQKKKKEKKRELNLV